MWKDSWEHWISLSDMMTGLMLVFLLISIVTISEIQKREINKNQIILEYNNTKEDISNDLKKAFQKNSKEWNMLLSSDLTIKFNNNELLFEANKSELKEEFKKILDVFIPKYFSIINNEKYNWKIKWVYIEWHAAWNWCLDYLECLRLSQERANSVLTYIFNSNYYKNLSLKDKRNIEFLLTSSWFSNWRSLDKNGNYIISSNIKKDNYKSRRVEFRILTNSDELIEKILNNKK